jgi:hypothetical protein
MISPSKGNNKLISLLFSFMNNKVRMLSLQKIRINEGSFVAKELVTLGEMFWEISFSLFF